VEQHCLSDLVQQLHGEQQHTSITLYFIYSTDTHVLTTNHALLQHIATHTTHLTRLRHMTQHYTTPRCAGLRHSTT
jgi:hypothetical protein